MKIISVFFFFFQAEDGIRYDLVTGVQTCALPISRASKSYLRTPWRLRAGAQTGNGRIPEHGQVQKSMEGAVLWTELPATHPRLVKQEKEKEPELSHNAAWAL